MILFLFLWALGKNLIVEVSYFYVQNSACRILDEKIWLHCSWCYFPTFPIQLSLVFSSRIRVAMWLEFWSEFEFFGQMTSAIFALISQFSHTKWCWFTLIFVYTSNTSLFFLFTFSAVASLLCHSHFFSWISWSSLVTNLQW